MRDEGQDLLVEVLVVEVDDGHDHGDDEGALLGGDNFVVEFLGGDARVAPGVVGLVVVEGEDFFLGFFLLLAGVVHGEGNFDELDDELLHDLGFDMLLDDLEDGFSGHLGEDDVVQVDLGEEVEELDGVFDGDLRVLRDVGEEIEVEDVVGEDGLFGDLDLLDEGLEEDVDGDRVKLIWEEGEGKKKKEE